MRTFTTEYLTTATYSRFYYFDRDVNDQIELPYNWYDIKIKPNDLVLAPVINGSFDKLYDNLLYLISRGKMPESLMPIKKKIYGFLVDKQILVTEGESETGNQYMKTSLEGLNVYYGTSSIDSELLEASAGEAIKNITAGVFTDHQNLSGVSVGVFFSQQQVGEASGTRANYITLIQDEHSAEREKQSTNPTQEGEHYDVNVVANTTTVDNFTERLLPPIDRCITQEDYIYALCSRDKIIYKYDILGLIGSDQAYIDPTTTTSGKLINNILGGPGQLGDDNKFINPKSMCVNNNNELLVLDHEGINSRVKWFDQHGNHMYTYDTTDVLQEVPIDIMFHDNLYYILTPNKIVTYTTDFEVTRIDEQPPLPAGEKYLQFVKSKEIADVVYIVTTKNVIKKFITKLNTEIGTFLFADRNINIDSLQNVIFAGTATSVWGEYVYVVDKGRGIIYKFNERMQYRNLVDSSFEKSFFKYTDIEIKQDDYVNHLVYNKSLAKLFYNHAAYGNSIISKALGSYNSTASLSLNVLRPLMPEQVLSRGRTPGLNNFIGANEPLITSVVNRTLEELYNLQLDMVRDLNVGALDTQTGTVITSIPSVEAPQDKKWVWIGGDSADGSFETLWPSASAFKGYAPYEYVINDPDLSELL